LFVSFFLANHAIQPFSGVVQYWSGWSAGLGAWKRLRETLRRYDSPPALPPEADAQPGLRIEKASFWPEGRERPIIGGIDLHLPPGAVLTIQGRNGVGKSTLLRLVLGLLPPTEGRVLLDGQDTHYCERDLLGARIGYLPQDVQLLETDIFANIGRGPDAPPEAVVAAARAAGVHDAIGRLPLGYQTQSGATSGLSAGQRRMVALARALYGTPTLLILDEPEVGLDGPSRNALRAAVERARLGGAVVLIVSHEPDTWTDMTDYRLTLSPNGIWALEAATRDASGKGTSFAAIG
jgi:ATP-binding cassette subfamily C protein